MPLPEGHFGRSDAASFIWNSLRSSASERLTPSGRFASSRIRQRLAISLSRHESPSGGIGVRISLFIVAKRVALATLIAQSRSRPNQGLDGQRMNTSPLRPRWK